MNPLSSALALAAATCLIAAGFAVLRPRRKRSILEISPRYRSFFRQLGVTETAHFLALPGETPHVVSGHPDRNVTRITFVRDGEQWNAFLKREHRVSWRTRLGNAFTGFGLLSRCLREARLLQILEREGLPGPEWLAAGEDDRGRAFLLVRGAPGMELRAVLTAEKDARCRRRIARKLGAALARLHTAGFHHPDLYANHLFLDLAGDSIHILDWQRACLRRTLSWSECRRGLAALHATMDDSLASAEERLLCLHTYWRKTSHLGVSWRAAVTGIETEARRLRSRRHIHEKRQPPVKPQAWICLAGESLCVTPAFQERFGEPMLGYVSRREEAWAASGPVRQRWLALPGAARVHLVQRQQLKSFARLWPSPRRSFISPEQRQASLLLRLQRHDIAAPQVLALGQHQAEDGRGESFLLTQPFPDTCSLETWLAYRSRRRAGRTEQKRRWSVLRQAGEMLRRLHEASCYLAFGSAGCGLAVCQTRGQVRLVLDNVDCVIPKRRLQPRKAARDLHRMQQMLHTAGCSRSDLCRFRSGYFGQNTVSEIGSRSHAEHGNAAGDAPRRVSLHGTQSVRTCVPTQSVGTRDLLWRRLLLGVRRVCQRPDWPRFAGANWADRIMDVAVTDRFHAKQGRSTGRWIVTGPRDSQGPTQRLSVYLKRHYELPRWRGWLATLWPWRNWSPAWQEWRQLKWARRQGVPVPQTVAVAEYIGPWGRLRSFLAVEELADMLSLQEAIPLAAVRQDARSFRQWKRGLAAEMARLTRMLHDRRCFHKDLYLCHFFIAREDTRGMPAEGWRGRLHLIDLHRLAHHPLSWRLWQTKDLAELLYSSEIIGMDARDRLAFWRAYRGEGPNRPRCPWIRRLILYRWQRYRRHNARDRQARQNEPAWT
ncbi:MAG TPA: lipopolysaccharide kinase InaA family protein [Gemmataceae bacterium]|nr:lipopolysaccharide kinase InaA family protein [Gemmataceae bacterium]